MRYLSVCSGIEAATVAWHSLGWTPAAFSEIEAFPSAVLQHQHAETPNWGDMTKFAEWPDADVDLLVGGTPCQSFSVAGLRKGLADPRGNLALTFLAIASKYAPRWILWENVPGVLSSGGGRDFGAFLGGLGQCGYGWAYRLLDAQYFGVPQRRRRVFVVGHLGDWRRAAAVLFERHSLSGDTPPRREKGQAAPTIPSRSTAGGGLGTDFDCDGGLVTFDRQSSGEYGTEPVASTVSARDFKGPSDLIAFEGLGVLQSALPPAQGRPTSAVRRLTPAECEALQGFPRNYTLIPYRGKPAADGPRYKALGNSMAVPVMRWIGERIQMVEALQTQAEAA